MVPIVAVLIGIIIIVALLMGAVVFGLIGGTRAGPVPSEGKKETG